jgi:hypothetical protein
MRKFWILAYFQLWDEPEVSVFAEMQFNTNLVTACVGYILLKLTIVYVLSVCLVCFIVSSEEEVKWVQEDMLDK